MSFTLGDFMAGKMPGISQETLIDSLSVIADVTHGFVAEVLYLHDVDKWMPDEPALPRLERPIVVVADAGRIVGAWRPVGEDLAECFRFDRHGNPSKKELHGTFRAAQVRVSSEHPEGEILTCTIVEVPRDLPLDDPVRPGIQTSVRMPKDEGSKDHFKKMRQWVQVCSQLLHAISEEG
jgi:hypothetical protein